MLNFNNFFGQSVLVVYHCLVKKRFQRKKRNNFFLNKYIFCFFSGLFATVRKCRHRTTGVEYAAKYAAKIRYGQDCTTEILHEIALMSLCTTNPRIIHLIDVFDTSTHMILVME